MSYMILISQLHYNYRASLSRGANLCHHHHPFVHSISEPKKKKKKLKIRVLLSLLICLSDLIVTFISSHFNLRSELTIQFGNPFMFFFEFGFSPPSVSF